MQIYLPFCRESYSELKGMVEARLKASTLQAERKQVCRVPVALISIVKNIRAFSTNGWWLQVSKSFFRPLVLYYALTCTSIILRNSIEKCGSSAHLPFLFVQVLQLLIKSLIRSRVRSVENCSNMLNITPIDLHWACTL